MFLRHATQQCSDQVDSPLFILQPQATGFPCHLLIAYNMFTTALIYMCQVVLHYYLA